MSQGQIVRSEDFTPRNSVTRERLGPEQKHQWGPSGLLHSYILPEQTENVREWPLDLIRPLPLPY